MFTPGTTIKVLFTGIKWAPGRHARDAVSGRTMSAFDAELNESFVYPVFRRSVNLYRLLRASGLRSLVECTATACALGRKPLSDNLLNAFDGRAAELIARGGGPWHLQEPTWAGNAGDAGAFGLLPQVLEGRTLLVVGDSVARQLAIDLLLAVRFYREEHLEPRAAPPAHVSLAVNTHCYVWMRDAFRFCFLRASRFSGARRVPRSAAGQVNATACLQTDLSAFDLGDALACTRHTLGIDSGDVVVVNAGVHHNQPEVSLRGNVESFVRWRDEARAAGRLPCTLWRETFATHFATADGTFQADASHRRALNLGCGRWDSRCSPLAGPLAREVGAGATRQKFNDASNPLLERAGVPILRTFLPSAALFDVHCECTAPEARELDCVHHAFPSPAYQLALHLLLLALEQRCGAALSDARGRGRGRANVGGRDNRSEACWPLARCARAGPLNLFG